MSNTEDRSEIGYYAGSRKAYEAEVETWADRMGYHKATPETVPLHRELRQDFIHCADMVIRKVPAGRERSLALTHLQTALMWANAGIAIELAPLALDD